MFNAIKRLFTEGDLNRIQSKLLHTSSWQQHLNTAYGETQLKQLWLGWLQHAGLCKIIRQEQISNGDGWSGLYLELQPETYTKPCRMLCHFEHNQDYLKQIWVSLDSALMLPNGTTPDAYQTDWLPEPDPLQISDYDHQLHTQTQHALPADFLAGHQPNITVIDRWWKLWRDIRLSDITEVYASNAEILLPGQQEPATCRQLFSLLTEQSMRMRRRYGQLVTIIQDKTTPDNLMVYWYLDGDINGIRTRCEMHHFLSIKDGKIVREYLVHDTLAWQKQFPNVSL